MLKQALPVTGWGGWIRTNEMAESESAALPLGDTPTKKSEDGKPSVPRPSTLLRSLFGKTSKLLVKLR